MCAAVNRTSPTSTIAMSSAVESTPPETAATIGPRMWCSAKKLRMASTITAIAYFVLSSRAAEAVQRNAQTRRTAKDPRLITKDGGGDYAAALRPSLSAGDPSPSYGTSPAAARLRRLWMTVHTLQFSSQSRTS